MFCKGFPTKIGVDNLKNWNSRRIFIIWIMIYTLFFCIITPLIFIEFIQKGYSFVWILDGKDQMHPWMVATGRWVREIIIGIIKGDFTIPMYDLSMGWGDDIIGYLSSSGQLEPINMFFAATVPLKHSELLYNFLVVFRLFLSGISFLFMCRYFGKLPQYSIVGCIVYVFSSYSLHYGLVFPYFVNTMIVLPIMVIGIDKLLKGKDAFTFIISSFLSALCGFYLLYMLTIIVVIYAFVRFFDIYHKGERLGNFPLLFARASLCYGIGLGLAAPVLLPGIMEFFYSARNGENHLVISNDIIMHLEALLIRFLTLISPSRLKSYDWFLDYLELPAVFLLVLAVLFTIRKKRSQKVLISIALLTWVCFLGGWIMNGFQYPCNRWLFGLYLIAGYLIVDLLPELLHIDTKQRTACLFAFVLYLVIAVAYYCYSYELFIYGIAFLTTSLIIVCLIRKLNGKIRKYCCGLLLVIIVANVIVNANLMISPNYGMSLIEFLPYGYETKRVDNSIEHTASIFLKGDLSKGRIDSTKLNYNDSLFFGVPGTAIYSSTENRNVMDFWTKMECSGNRQIFKTHSTDQRTLLNTLLSVNYQFELKKGKAYIPFGYAEISNIKNDKGKVFVYDNNYALPWGYTYANSISYKSLEKMNGLEKQEVLLQAVALDENQSVNLQDLKFDSKQIAYDLKCINCSWENGNFISDNYEASIILKASLSAGKEYYVRIKGLDIDGYGDDYLTVNGASAIHISVKCGKIEKTSLAETKEYPWYYGRKDYLFCLGYSTKDRGKIEIKIPAKGHYKLEDIELFELPLDDYPKRVDALREEPLENIVVGKNSISGTVDLSNKKTLCLTIPFSKGWSVYVDGIRQDILKANYAFMGVKLPAGHHKIVFKYCTPGLYLGIVLFLLSIAGFIYILLYERKKKRNE